MMERCGAPTLGNLNLFLVKGEHSSSACWSRVLSDKPEYVRPLRDYFDPGQMIDLEADAIMIRLGRLIVDRLGYQCLLSTTDSDVLISLVSVGCQDIFWAKQLEFKT